MKKYKVTFIGYAAKWNDIIECDNEEDLHFLITNTTIFWKYGSPRSWMYEEISQEEN